MIKWNFTNFNIKLIYGIIGMSMRHIGIHSSNLHNGGKENYLYLEILVREACMHCHRTKCPLLTEGIIIGF
jgi:hypothetical protein